MRLKAFFIMSVFVIFFISCVSYNKKNTHESRETVVIRYMSLETVYNRALSADEKASDLINTEKALSVSISDLEKRILIDEKERVKLISELNMKRNELKKVNKKIALIKSAIYKRINNAVKRAARNIGADFILNIGDEVLYSKKEYDITEDIIREMINQSKRSAPVSR